MMIEIKHYVDGNGRDPFGSWRDWKRSNGQENQE